LHFKYALEEVFIHVSHNIFTHMPASGKRHSNRAMTLLSGLIYKTGLFCIKLSRVPVIGGPIGRIVGGRNLKVITIPLDLRLQSEYSILPPDAAHRLVESASYIAGLDVCICRESRHCTDYPLDAGCMFLGEGARTIRYKGAHEITKAEALDRLERAKRLGLVNNAIWSSNEMKILGADEKRTVELCSCCPCCCLMFKTRNGSRAFTDSFKGFGICKVVNADECTHCTNCERACPFRAIHANRQSEPYIDVSICKGCGRCEIACKHAVLKVFPLYEQPLSEKENGVHMPDAADDFERFLTMVR
jgi:Pyruvate/2-oxoacid:ferredoxin oxidoreductase delta subunit